MTVAEIAWAAGLFEGEGSASIDKNGSARMQLKMVDEESVRRFHGVVALGKVYGPYVNNSGDKDGYPRSDFYTWVATRSAAVEVAETLYSWLSAVRRNKIDLMLNEQALRTAKLSAKNVETAQTGMVEPDPLHGAVRRA